MADTPEAQAKGTMYIVLEEQVSTKIQDDGEKMFGEGVKAYLYIGEATAQNDKQAIALLLTNLGRATEDGEHSFVAVPARSFKVRTRKQETRTLWG